MKSTSSLLQLNNRKSVLSLSITLIFSIFFVCSAQNNNSLEKSIQDLVESLSEQNKFSGCIILSDGHSNKIIEKCVGYNSIKNDFENTPETKFSLASVGKLFTILSIIQLIEKGKINYNDKLSDFNFEFNDPRAKEITIHQLLSHTSGFGHYWDNPQFLKMQKTLDEINEYMTFIKETELLFDPGTQYNYSNEGYIILGSIIEQVTGTDYYSHVENNVFQPLSMHNSGHPYKNQRDNSYATGIVFNSEGTPLPPASDLSQRGASDGGGYSTVRDMSNLMNAVFNGDFIDEKALSLMTSNFESDEINKESIVFDFNGASPGVSTIVGYHGPSGLNVVVLSNFDSPASETVVLGIMDMLMQQTLPEEEIKENSSSYIEGIILDSNNQPIPYVNIGIIDKYFGTSSDENGHFSIEIPEKYLDQILTISALGHKNTEVKIKENLNTEIKVVLNEDVETLSTVFISTKKPKRFKNGNSSLALIPQGAYIGSKIPGASLTKMITAKKNGKIEKLVVHVQGNKLNQDFILRARILESNKQQPGKDLLTSSVIQKSNIKKGWLEFDLSEFNLSIDKNKEYFIGVEWIDKNKSVEKPRDAFPRVSYDNKKSTSYAKKGGLERWNSIDINPNFYLVVIER
ncbi:serine hydrolase [Winogradskyella sp.]|uniref:serine hydrolase n=1 Tax=Winogradskyella sp. TaxID=1883156 RepID=UPI00261F61FB|nr:serine hydrolase [Winogradskyella sp.]